MSVSLIITAGFSADWWRMHEDTSLKDTVKRQRDNVELLLSDTHKAAKYKTQYEYNKIFTDFRSALFQ